MIAATYRGRSTMPSVLFVITSNDRLGETGKETGYYVPEAAHPWHEVTRAGFEVRLASIQGGTPPAIGYDPGDAVQSEFWNDPDIGRQLQNTPAVRDIDTTDLDAVLFVGGHGTMWDFPDDPDVQRIIREVYEQGGVVAAVCHGPAALVNARLSDGRYLVDGKTVAAFTTGEEVAVELQDTVPFLLAEELKRHGANHVEAPNFEVHVEVDGRLITGQNPASAGPVGSAIAQALVAPTKG
jgi:putative intracellular protease/amidase